MLTHVLLRRGLGVFLAGGLLMIPVFKPAAAQEEKSSCVTCHTNADMLEENVAAGAGPAKSPLQAGVG